MSGGQSVCITLSHGGQGTVEVNGVDIGNVVSKVEITCDPRSRETTAILTCFKVKVVADLEIQDVVARLAPIDSDATEVTGDAP
jgi:hypothetical protein